MSAVVYLPPHPRLLPPDAGAGTRQYSQGDPNLDITWCTEEEEAASTILDTLGRQGTLRCTACPPGLRAAAIRTCHSPG